MGRRCKPAKGLKQVGVDFEHISSIDCDAPAIDLFNSSVTTALFFAAKVKLLQELGQLINKCLKRRLVVEYVFYLFNKVLLELIAILNVAD